MHAISKLIGFITLPSFAAFLAILVGWWLLRRGKAVGKIWVGYAVLFLAVAGLSPLGNALILPLEAQFPRIDAGQAEPAGVIILGGAEDGRMSAARGGLGLNEAAERITEAARLARRWPQAKIVFTGGVGRLLPGDVPGAEPVAAFLESMGVASSRITLEARSRTTYENAVFTREAMLPLPGERWLLITSAYHMPRAMGVFRRAGFDVTAYPVDFRTAGSGDLWRLFDSIPDGLKRVDLAVREWIGLTGYWLAGRTDALFPKPKAG